MSESFDNSDRPDSSPTGNDKGDETLDRALDALRAADIPEPPDDVVSSTIELLNSIPPPASSRSHHRRQMIMRIARFSGFSAAAILLAFAAVWTLFISNKSAVAFEDVIAALEKVTSATCVHRQTIGEQPEIKSKFSLQPDRIRMEIDGQMIAIVDLKRQKALQLIPSQKIAMEINLRGAVEPSLLANPLEQLRRLKPTDAKPRGEAMLDGKRCLMFETNGELLDLNGPMTLWVDPKTGLPVRVQVPLPGRGPEAAPMGNMVFEDFKWNVPLGDALFSLAVPKGYSAGGAKSP